MFRNKKAGKFLLAAILALTTRAAPAQAAVEDDYFDLPPEQLLSAEVISVSRQSGTTFESPAAVFVITNEDIIRSGVTTIPEALRMAPGVQVARDSSNTWAVSIRGFNATLANKLLVLIDGRTIYNPLHSGVYWEAQNLMLEDVERIEVVRGPGGALWGSNAVNGVINIITKKAQDTQGILLSHGYGNHERGFASGRYGGPVGENAFYRAYASYLNRDSFHAADGDGDAPDEWEGYRGGFRMDWDGGRDDLTFQGDVYEVDSGQWAQDFSLTAPFSTLSEETAVNTGANLLGRWTRDLESGAVLTIQSYIDYTTREETVLADDRFIFDVEGQYNFPVMGMHEIVAGAGYRYMIDNLSGSVLTAFDPASRKDPLYSAFLQDRMELVPAEWFLTLGVKVEQHHYTDFEMQPNARLQWFPDDRQTVWAAVSQAVRTPSRIERDLILTNLTIPPGFFPLPAEIRLVNNKDFDAEKLTAYELGYRNRITPDFAVDTAAFYNEYHDLASTGSLGVIAAAGPPAHFIVPLIAQNNMTAESYGAELAADWHVGSGWDISASYSYIELFVHAPLLLGTVQNAHEGRIPTHQARLRSSWDFSGGWTLDTALYYVDEFRGPDVPSYIRADANLGWEINENVQFNLVGQNLFDDTRAEFSNTGVNSSDAGTSVYAKLTWRFP